MRFFGRFFFALSFHWSLSAFAFVVPPAVEEILHEFRSEKSATLMSEPTVKRFSEGAVPRALTNPVRAKESDKLLATAQEKATDRFERDYCARVLSKQFPALSCEDALEGKSSAVVHDRLELLTDGWVEKTENQLSKILVTGKTGLRVWSGHDWPIIKGGLSFRYRSDVPFFRQPEEWFQLVDTVNGPKSRDVLNWSPAEKYDLTVGDDAFSLSQHQVAENIFYPDKPADWVNNRHGWAAAAIRVPRPTQTISVRGQNGIQVTWYPQDVRALATLAWANGKALYNYVGGRCRSTQTRLLSNGRLAQESCFDVTPSLFHLALGNLVGKAKASFIVDKAFDHEVWNQPVHSYEFLYFNPLKPQARAKDWSEVAVDYNESFKALDPFQSPLTRGKKSKISGKYSDKDVSKVVGVIAKVVYLDNGAVDADTNSTFEEYLIYDLELAESGEEYIAVGGQWYSNNHPTHLWTVRKGSIALKSTFDFPRSKFGDDEMKVRVRELATGASEEGYPLCDVVSWLIKKSSGSAMSVGCRAEY